MWCWRQRPRLTLPNWYEVNMKQHPDNWKKLLTFIGELMCLATSRHCFGVAFCKRIYSLCLAQNAPKQKPFVWKATMYAASKSLPPFLNYCPSTLCNIRREEQKNTSSSQQTNEKVLLLCFIKNFAGYYLLFMHFFYKRRKFIQSHWMGHKIIAGKSLLIHTRYSVFPFIDRRRTEVGIPHSIYLQLFS